MMQNMILPKEGDLYKIYAVENHIFEIRYGYYEENERGRVEPLPVFPDFLKHPVYTAAGEPVTSLIQVSCEHYTPKEKSSCEFWCGDCIYYGGSKVEIGICLCPRRKRE